MTIRDLLDGRYEGSFRLTVGGDYRLEVRLAGVRVGHEWVTVPAPSHVVNSPSHVHCHASVGRALHGMTLVVEGEGLKRAQVAEAAKFKVHAVAPESANRRSAAPHCRIEVRLYKPDMLLRPDGLVAEGRATKARSSGGIDDARETSTWECSYKARVAGQFLLMVTADGAPLRDSPYAVRVLPGRVDLTQCEANLARAKAELQREAEANVAQLRADGLHAQRMHEAADARANKTHTSSTTLVRAINKTTLRWVVIPLCICETTISLS